MLEKGSPGPDTGVHSLLGISCGFGEQPKVATTFFFLPSRKHRKVFTYDTVSFVLVENVVEHVPLPFLVSSGSYRCPSEVSMHRIDSFEEEPIPSRSLRDVSLSHPIRTGSRSGFEPNLRNKRDPFGSIPLLDSNIPLLDRVELMEGWNRS